LVAVIPTIVGASVVEAGLPLAEVPQLIGALVAQNATALAEVPGITTAIILGAQGAYEESYVEDLKGFIS